MIECVLEGEKILDSNNGLDEFGKLLHTAWITKKKVSKVISNSKIDEIYEYMISQGALGGKLLGAGGGGFFLFYMKNHLQKRFLKKENLFMRLKKVASFNLNLMIEVLFLLLPFIIQKKIFLCMDI